MKEKEAYFCVIDKDSLFTGEEIDSYCDCSYTVLPAPDRTGAMLIFIGDAAENSFVSDPELILRCMPGVDHREIESIVADRGLQNAKYILHQIEDQTRFVPIGSLADVPLILHGEFDSDFVYQVSRKPDSGGWKFIVVGPEENGKIEDRVFIFRCKDPSLVDSVTDALNQMGIKKMKGTVRVPPRS